MQPWPNLRSCESHARSFARFTPVVMLEAQMSLKSLGPRRKSCRSRATPIAKMYECDSVSRHVGRGSHEKARRMEFPQLEAVWRFTLHTGSTGVDRRRDSCCR